MIDMIGENRVLDRVLEDGGTAAARTLEIYGVKSLNELVDAFFIVKATLDGMSGNCTMKINTLAAKPLLVSSNGVASTPDNLWSSIGQLYILIYNGVNFIAYPLGATGNTDIYEPSIQQTYIQTEAEIAQNTNYNLPDELTYIVGANNLEIYYMGEKLVKGLHYIEVGTTGNDSNIIQFKDWGQSIPAGRTIEFIVRN